MGSFSFNTAVRVLVLTSLGVRAFIWQGGRLQFSRQFRTTEQSQAEFVEYLKLQPKYPLFLVPDVIEEDYRLENVVAVRGRDRQVLLERKLAQFFRTAEYRSAKIQGREEEGRKDYRVLFSALLNTEQISFWVQRILEQKAPLKGILSVPWLLESFARSLQLDKVSHLLMINLEQESGFRQTYMQSGRLKFSRLTSLATVHLQSLAETIIAECVHTRQYLERLKLITRDQPLQVHFAVQGEVGEEIAASLVDTPLLHFHLHETGVLAAELGLDPDQEEGQGVLFLALTNELRNKGLWNVYASSTALRYYRYQQIRQGIIAGTSVFFAAILTGCFFLLQQGMKQQHVLVQLQHEALALSQQSVVLQEKYPASPVHPLIMQKMVSTADTILSRTSSPMETMKRVSHALDKSPEIALQKIEWSFEPVSLGNKEGESDSVSQLPGMTGDKEHDQGLVLLQGLLAAPLQVTMTLSGMVVSSGTGFKQAQQSVEEFILELQKEQGVQVIPVAMPTQSDPAAAVAVTMGEEARKQEFVLRLVYQAKP